MKLSKKGELVAVGSALYLLGLEIEGNKAKLQEIADQYEEAERIPITQELVENVVAIEKARKKFAKLEERYKKLLDEVLGEGSGQGKG